MKDNLLKTEKTKAGLKIYYQFDKDSPSHHIKTVKCRYEPIITNLDWIRDYKKILLTKEERMYLEMKYQIYSIEWINQAQREFVNRQEVVSVKEVCLRNDPNYYVVVMSEGTEVRVSKTVYSMAVKYGVQVQSIKRLV